MNPRKPAPSRKKKANGEPLALGKWWRRRESNLRPQTICPLHGAPHYDLAQGTPEPARFR